MAQPLAGFVPIMLKNTWGWNAVFVCFVCVTVFSAIVLIPVSFRKQVLRE